MLCVCAGDVMYNVFSVCIMRCGCCRCSCMGSVSVFRHADVVCLCLVQGTSAIDEELMGNLDGSY